MQYEDTLKPSPYYNETHDEWRRQVRRFVMREIEPFVQAWDTESDVVPRELFRKAGDLGLFGIGYPEEYGGLGDEFDIFHDLIVMDELHRSGSGGVASALLVHKGGLPPVNALGSHEIKQRVLLVDAVNYAQQRKTFGRRLADHQVIRHKFAEMARKINATQAYIEQNAWRVQQGEQPGADAALCKVQATKTLEFCAREAAHVLGGASVIRGNNIERIIRDSRTFAIAGGSEEILRDLAVRQMGI